jgi:hypothetical protein
MLDRRIAGSLILLFPVAALASEAGDAATISCMDYRWVSVHVAQIAAQAMTIRPP